MKKILFVALMLVAGVNISFAQKPEAKIKFDQELHDFGKFTEAEGEQHCVFTFVNEGDAPLIINQAVASCGCTVPSYTKTPIAPGEKGEIKVTYNGKNRFPGHFKKSITVRTNGKPEMTRLYIEGVMETEEQ